MFFLASIAAASSPKPVFVGGCQADIRALPPADSSLLTVFVFLAVILLVIAVLTRWHRRRVARRNAYLSSPLPARWELILRRRVPLFSRLPEEIRDRLRKNVKRFLAEKEFTACGGLRSVSNAMSVTIAGHACLLLAGRDYHECFPGVASILVYPDAFLGREHTWNLASGTEIVHPAAPLLGEANASGSVVLSWRETLRASVFAGNGHNLVLHEFAHHIRPSGSTLLAEIETGFRRLRSNPSDPVLDSYGAEDKDEFWAVSVEAFFADAPRLREFHPTLYAALADFFFLSPADW
ncbi:MAG: zinc-dependent peptidase [Puniceicoccales bacterium]|nr:zinc-dependent peptidase [Puniceicoccales bacterium]